MTYTNNRRQQRNWIDTLPTNGVNLFGRQYQNSYEDWYNQPRVQILTPREPPPQKRVHYCSKCNGKIEWIENRRVFVCYTCALVFNELYDKPLSSVDQAIAPLQGEGSDKPVFVSIPRDKRLQGEYHSDIIDETRSYHGGRVRHIKLKPGVSPASYSIRQDLNNNND